MSLMSLSDIFKSSLIFMIAIILPSLRTRTSFSRETNCNSVPLSVENMIVPIKSKGIAATKSIQNLDFRYQTAILF
jgi:hypothetical protein